MSMLTPPGMGGKNYRVTGDRYPRMRRPRHRRRIVLTLLATVCALGLVGWGTLQLIDVFGFGGGRNGTAQAAQDKKHCPGGGKATAGAQAQPAARKPPAPGTLTVNVLNATARAGLAKQTADELQRRGFKIGKVGNAPAAYDKKIKGIGMLLGSRAATDGPLKVLATQLAGAQQKTDDRKNAELDLLLGDTFKALATPQAAARSLALLTHPAPEPSADAKC
ncbi:LytR C-terminal domain-containing protein [Streptomyces sp. NPDC001339]|uniref:LytR C-terminal domain-containing protein n=1 Tax=Streptomyces sp. NPDC001339 TaxID=3364563 RepID=UPI00367E4F66